jgi:hypothetical protein
LVSNKRVVQNKTKHKTGREGKIMFFQKKLVCLWILSFFAFLLFFSCALTPEKTQPEPGEPVAHFPKMKVGDKWVKTGWSKNKRTDTYHLEIKEVRQDGSFVVLGSAEKGGYTWYEYWNKEHQLEKFINGAGKTIIQEKPLRNTLDFPLFVGKRWETKYSAYSKGGHPTEYIDIYKVKSYETVKTNAGYFKAFKISRTNRPTEISSHIYNSIEWYSPELKSIIKVKNPDFPPTELLDYKLVNAETKIFSKTPTAPPESPQKATKIKEKLEELNNLRENGLITQNDYDKKKDELLENY